MTALSFELFFLQRILKRFSRFEFRHGYLGNLDAFRWFLWIDAHARVPAFGGKRSETGEDNFISFFEFFNNRADEGIDEISRLFFGEGLRETGFVHILGFSC